MTDSGLAPPFRWELREMLEFSHPFHLYGFLRQQAGPLEETNLAERLAEPMTDGLRKSLELMLPRQAGPVLTLSSRVALCSLLEQTRPEEEESFTLALLEYFSLQLEPYLEAAEMDPDQQVYLNTLLTRWALEERPAEAFLGARRAIRRTTSPPETSAHVCQNRAADGS